jgi:hypothetical protein
MNDAVIRPRTARDFRRWLQLSLAALWLFDAMLQFQPFMFSTGFGRMLASAADGNPAVVAGPVTWTAQLTGHHPALANAVFGTVQLLLALGIAWRPAVKIALTASIAWALGVWWLGEGLGGLLTPAASPVTGAPGAALLYAVLAVLLWPSGQTRPAAFAAGRTLGPAAARMIWVLLWFSLAWFSVANAPAAAVPALRSGPGPLILAAVCCLIAAGILLPAPGVRCTAAVAVGTALALWAGGQDFGGIITGTGTDPGTGPLLALLAVSYWPGLAAPGGPALAAPGGPARAGLPRPGPAHMGRDTLVMQATMGAATAGMLVPRLDPVPLAAWQVLAAAGTAWFTWRCLRAAITGRRVAHHVPHALACAAMLYMLLASPAGRSAPGGSALMAAGEGGLMPTAPMHAAHLPLLAIALAVAMAAAAVITTDRLTSLAPAQAPGATPDRAAPPGHAARRTALPRRFPAPAVLPGGGGWPLMMPRLAACCQIAMGIAMAYLLIQML